MGAEGWELISVNPFVFKRLLSDRPEPNEPIAEKFVSGATHKDQTIQIFALSRGNTIVGHRWVAGDDPASTQTGTVYGDKDEAIEAAKSAIDEFAQNKSVTENLVDCVIYKEREIKIFEKSVNNILSGYRWMSGLVGSGLTYPSKDEAMANAKEMIDLFQARALADEQS